MGSRDLTIRINFIFVVVLMFMGVGLGYATTKYHSSIPKNELSQNTLTQNNSSLIAEPLASSGSSNEGSARDTTKSNLIRLRNYMDEYLVGRKVYILEDPSRELTINDVHNKLSDQWYQSEVDIPSFGFSKKVYWFYLDVENNSDLAREWLLELSYPLVDKLHLYFFAEDGGLDLYRVGTDRPFGERPINHRNFVFPLQFEAQQKARIYIRVDSEDSIQMPLRFWSERKFLESDQIFLLAQGFYYGAMMIMAVYNLFVFLFIRDRSYLFYVMYVVSFTSYQLSTHGLAFQYVWPESVSWNAVSTPMLSALTITFASLFIMDFLALRKHAIVLYRLMLGAALVASIASLASYLFPYGIVMEFVAVLAGFVAMVGLSSGLYLWNKGHITARYFSVAFICLFVGVLMLILNKFGIIPRNFVTERSAQIGAVFEVFLLSLALAGRINRERKRRFIAQKHALEEMAEKEKAESQLVHQTLHDSLIGCPNRSMLKRRMEELISSEPDRQLGILLIQLTRFHEINNTLGHQNGDELLKRVARRLTVMVNDIKGLIYVDESDRKSGGYAMVEGVSFGVIVDISNGDCQSRIGPAANKLLQALSYPFEFKGMTLEISAKVGVSLYPDHGNDVHALLQHAHVAVEVAQQSNDFVATYSAEVDPYSARRLVLVGELRSAIKCNELQLYFQPQLDLGANAVIGAEALLRWVHPLHGFIPPDEFVMVAEQTGLIKPLTEWVLDNAIRQTSRFLKKGYRLKVSVNLSAKNLQERDLVQQLMLLLDRYNVPPGYLVLEITETAMMLDPKQALMTLSKINECGIGLSVDDFGTGYSSLSYLKQLPVNEIKIDRSFVMDMSSGSDDEIIVNTTLNMSHNLGLKVVAEGVENQEVLTALKLMGCDIAQGYFFSKPIPADEFEKWLIECEYSVGTVVDISQSGYSA